jgi:hypothetical protein
MFMDFSHRLKSLKTQLFGKMMFPSSGKIMGALTLFRPLGRAISLDDGESPKNVFFSKCNAPSSELF